MSIPDNVRGEIKESLWEEADRLDWASLSASEKARQYTMWTETPSLGGRLASFMDPRQVRVYIKDTLLKDYTRERMADPDRVLRILGIAADTTTEQTFIKPHGRRLSDGRVIAWSRANDWKLTFMALHERAFESGGRPYAAVLFEAATKYPDPPTRKVVESAARKLEIEQLIWLD